ncbi:alpha/beta hydrolase [Actinoplanes sp. KI2]|uniref:alpha/beta fold hydrolase n=1 Tax=Actinoplanes sp. KI2 TaxID=2983315 RepID=UPI0021D603C5|nr:alpha/beta hydrolase [Actinoplanes sp. KI2]MCU7726595.1 alpha/beta hydrolase [Actinoplanes sp. KI2]
MRTVAEGFAEVPDGYLYYRQHGHGPDVVLLNAGLADVRMWDTTVAWLADIARVTTWDYRDTGLSSWSSRPYREIDDLEAVLDAAGVARATLLGASDGGRQALAFAHRHPGRVVKVCVVGGSFGEFPDPAPRETAARQQMRKVFDEVERHLRNQDILAASTVDVDAWSPAVNAADRRRLIGWHVANSRVLTMPQYHGVELDPPVKTRFAEIDTPIAVFAGGRDFEGTRLWAARLADQAPQASLFVAPDADHFPMFSDPTRFERFVREAIAD